MRDRPADDAHLRCCDLVLKGGITSGVLYPSAIQEIGRRFELIGIGGTSAGAIGACAAAAAEFRRRNGSAEGYDALGRIAEELGQPGRLLSLMRPDRNTRWVWKIILRIAQGKGGIFDYARLFLFKRRAVASLVENGYGLASGMAHGDGDGAAPLTAWLAELIDEIAGKADAPLSFADLHNAPQAKAAGAHQRRSIDLRAVTTCVTFGRPFELPFDSEIFAFDPDEFGRLFPARVVEHMVRAAEAVPSKLRRRDGKLPLPMADLPVVVAARMSLSFPGLISMVPLWSPNFREAERELRRVWFSDGGVTCNFPIQRFDRLYPRWPTLGINLQYTGPSGEPQRNRARAEDQMIYMPSRPGDGVLDLWNDFDRQASPIATLMAFVSAIFGSAQSWQDRSFMRLPAYRDRVAEIWLSPEEGGMNLDMPPEIITRLVERGARAGRDLAARFADAPDEDPLSWNAHRWTRYRSSMSGLCTTLEQLAETLEPGSRSGEALTHLLSGREVPPSLRFRDDAQLESAREATAAIRALATRLAAMAGDGDGDSAPFADGPRPAVDVVTRAPF